MRNFKKKNRVFCPYQEASERDQPSPPSSLPPFAALNRLQGRFQGHFSAAAAFTAAATAATGASAAGGVSLAVVATSGCEAADVIAGQARGGGGAPEERRVGTEEVRENRVETVGGGFRHGSGRYERGG